MEWKGGNRYLWHEIVTMAAMDLIPLPKHNHRIAILEAQEYIAALEKKLEEAEEKKCQSVHKDPR
jgi:hypothetical protein